MLSKLDSPFKKARSHAHSQPSNKPFSVAEQRLIAVPIYPYTPRFPMSSGSFCFRSCQVQSYLATNFEYLSHGNSRHSRNLWRNRCARRTVSRRRGTLLVMCVLPHSILSLVLPDHLHARTRESCSRHRFLIFQGYWSSFLAPSSL